MGNLVNPKVLLLLLLLALIGGVVARRRRAWTDHDVSDPGISL